MFFPISSSSSSWVALDQSGCYFPSPSCPKKRTRTTKSCRCHCRCYCCCCCCCRLTRSRLSHCCRMNHHRSCQSHCCRRRTSFSPSFPTDLPFPVPEECSAYFHFPSASSSSQLFLKVCGDTCVFQCIHKSSVQIPNTSGSAHFVCWPPLVFEQ